MKVIVKNIYPNWEGFDDDETQSVEQYLTSKYNKRFVMDSLNNWYCPQYTIEVPDDLDEDNFDEAYDSAIEEYVDKVMTEESPWGFSTVEWFVEE